MFFAKKVTKLPDLTVFKSERIVIATVGTGKKKAAAAK
jgi:hypothetical protein